MRIVWGKSSYLLKNIFKYVIISLLMLIYEKTQFTTLQGLTGSVDFKVSLPDNSSCSFSGTCSVKLAGVGVNAALTYTLSIKPDSATVWA